MANITSKLIISILIVTCLTSCTVTKILNLTLLKYDIALIEVSGVKNSMEYGELAYVDSLIGINFLINQREISFALRNMSTNTLKIIWDETLYIVDEITGKVMHSGIKYTDKEMFQPPSVIPKGTVHSDVIVPTDNVYYNDGIYGVNVSIAGGWEKRELFPQTVPESNKDNMISKLKGSEFTIYMPIQVKGVTQEYNFRFKVINVADSKTYVPVKLTTQSKNNNEIVNSKKPLISEVGITADIDGNQYPIFQIGTKMWMSGNLKVTRFNNGDLITEIISDNKWSKTRKSAWSMYDNSLKYGKPLGYLYNGNAVVDERNMCPSGWHVATDSDWDILIKNLGGTKDAGIKLRATKGWLPNINGTNESGLKCIPGGSRNENGEFYGAGKIGVWWSSTSDASGLKLYARGLSNDKEDVVRYAANPKIGAYVRCVRD
jgi:uncharacterized protein (TIGR02145 family)